MAILTVYTKLLDKTLEGDRIIDMGSTKSCECHVLPRDMVTRAIDHKQTAFLNISFTHHVAVFRYAETYDERKYYIQLAYNQRLTVDDLEEMIKARVYDHRE